MVQIEHRAPSRVKSAAVRTAARMPRAIEFMAWLLIAAMLLASAGHARAQDPVPSLVLPATASDNARYATTIRRPDPGVVRQRPIGVDVAALDDRQKAAAALRVDLFDGQAVLIARDRLERRADANFTWHGRLLGNLRGYALITVVNGQVSGTIELGDPGAAARTRYRIETTADGVPLLQQIDAASFPDDHPAGVEPLAPAALKSKLRVGADALSGTMETLVTKADTAATIDVMIVYSNQTAAVAGSAIAAQAQQAVDTANLVYANSGITTRLRLVYAGPANYDESGDFNTDLNRLTTGTDGYMDAVGGLRNTYGADLVSLFVENGQYCGMGWIGPSANYGFSVINRGCASGNLSYPHELGHNFGARHDTYVDAATTPYAYGHGWVDVGQGWRDVMAYNTACAAYGVNCTRIAYFSNPNLTYGNPADPLGSTATADVARVHNQNAQAVANFRASTQGGSTSCSWSLAASGATVAAPAGSASVGVTTQTGCTWNAASNASWLTAGAGGSGPGTLAYSYTANSGPARIGTLTVAGVAFTVSQASGCTYALGASSTSVASAGGSGSVALTTSSACPWTAGSSASWLTVTSVTSGTGSATVSYMVAANTGAARSANLTIGGLTFLVSQAAVTITQAPATAALSPAALDFGSVMVGKSLAKTATLTNAGGGTLTISSLSPAGMNASEFSVGGTCAANTALAAGQSCTISITFRPAAIGTRLASVAINTSSNATTLMLSGTGRKSGRK